MRCRRRVRIQSRSSSRIPNPGSESSTPESRVPNPRIPNPESRMVILPSHEAIHSRSSRPHRHHARRLPRSPLSADPPGDWPLYSRNLAGTRYSPLTDINTNNVAHAHAGVVGATHAACGGRRGGGRARSRAAVKDGAAPPGIAAAGAGSPATGAQGRPAARGTRRGKRTDASGSNPQATPIVVNGVMYLPARGNQVLALDARHRQGDVATPAAAGDARRPRAASRTGRATAASRRASSSPRVRSWSRSTPRPASRRAASARDGMVEIARAVERRADDLQERRRCSAPRPAKSPLGPPGDTRAFDVRTGTKLWEFHTVPLPGEIGHETWLDDGWTGPVGREHLGVVHDARRAARHPLHADRRSGGELLGRRSSRRQPVRELDRRGRCRDRQVPAGTSRPCITTSGIRTCRRRRCSSTSCRTAARVPALASVGKTGWMFILDRTTGKPIFGVEERPVPKGDVPGEWYSPTQPFPVKPAGRSARVDFNKERDMVRPEDTSAEHVAACQALWDKSGGFYNAGAVHAVQLPRGRRAAEEHDSVSRRHRRRELGRRRRRSDERASCSSTRTTRRSSAGSRRRSPGVNYGRGTEGLDAALRSRQRQRRRARTSRSARRCKDASGRTIANLPCQRPPWARLVAVNANTGEIAWQTPLGLNEALPEGKQNVGGSGSAGPTVTAGGLVFVGATNDRRFRAFDSKTGKELWVAQARRTRSTRTR